MHEPTGRPTLCSAGDDVRYLVLATDYDGTLAHDGVTDESTVAAVERFRAAGGRPILVTGRELPDLQRTFPRLELFERVVVENGGLLYDPATRRERVLGPASDARLVDAMQARGVSPLSVGRTIIATVEPHQQVALECIRTLGLELQVIFNKGAVMVLPSGVNKATGLCAALEELSLSSHNVVGIGDAENDHALLDMCELSVATANAIPSLKARADLVTAGARGFAVQELIDRLLGDPDDSALSPMRHWLTIGGSEAGPVALEPHGRNLLVSGPSGAGKSTLTNTLLEQLADHRYQFCLVDPEGDYEAFTRAIRIGTAHSGAPIEEVVGALQRPDQNVIVSLTGVPKAERPEYFASLLPRIQELRVRTGRPHWLVIDEAHHVLPADWRGAATLIPHGWSSLAMVTLEPTRVSPLALRELDIAVAIGQVLPELTDLLAGCGIAASPDPLAPGAGRMWRLRAPAAATTAATTAGTTFEVRTPTDQHRRHRRKYIEGSLSPETQFVFSGPGERLHLSAQNLAEFLRLAEGVDDETWGYHLGRGDFSQWFRDVIKDDELAHVAADIESQPARPRPTAFGALRQAIEDRYTL